MYPFDPNRDEPGWIAFQKRYASAYGAKVDSFAALGFDSMNILLDSICRAGLNRGRIRDALYSIERYHGVTGDMLFDPNAKNIAPLFLGTVKQGKFVYRRYPMDKPYASLRDQTVAYAGPPIEDATSAPAIGVFGPHAGELAAKWQRADYRIEAVSSEAAWGKSSTALVNLMREPDLIGVIATDRASAHLATQIAVKNFVPVIALSADHTLTSTNIPWIFRLGSEYQVPQAIQCFVDAARQVGANRGRIREYLAAGNRVGAGIAFESSGEPR